MKKNALFEKDALFHSRYRLKKFLGRGQFSEVWLATDEQTNMSFALKIFAPATGMDENGAKMLAREFALVANVNHPNLLTAMHYDICDNKPYLVLPYCERGSCQTMIGNMNEDEVWKFIHDVASGLACLHSNKPEAIIHQDIKPANIMIGPDGRYMISDFGVSTKSRSNLRKSVGISHDSDGTDKSGTRAYMGPERFGSDPIPVKASDIWSLGATVYELITKDVPFNEEGGLFQKGGAEIPNIKGDFSNDLRYTIRSCMHFHPWDRPTAETLMRWSENRKVDNGDNTYDKKETGGGILKPLLIGFAAALVVISLFFGIRTFLDNNSSDNNGTNKEVINNYNQLVESCRSQMDQGNLDQARELLPAIQNMEQRPELKGFGEHKKLSDELSRPDTVKETTPAN